MNKNKKTDVNLLSTKLLASNIYKKSIPSLVAIMVIALLYVVISLFVTGIVVDKLDEKIVEIERTSVKNTNNQLNEELSNLRMSLEDKRMELRNEREYGDRLDMDNRPGNTPKDTSRYGVNNLITYINEIKPSNVTIILIEDDKTIGNPRTGEGDEFSLKYSADIGTSLINVRGFSTNRTSLAEFLRKFGKYNDMEEFKVKAVESVKMLDSNIDVFDIDVKPGQRR